jgi:tetratricopeptide (TPR) repeat protein
MALLDDWRGQIPLILSEIAGGLTSNPQLDLGLVATGVLWPLRKAIRSNDSAAIDAVRHVAEQDSDLVLQLMCIWPDNLQVAASQTAAEAREAKLQAALVRTVAFFDALDLLTAKIVQQYTTSTAGTTNFFGEIKAALLSIGGTIQVQSLTIQLPIDEEARANRRRNAAIVLLTTLPLDTVPEPTTLPIPHHMPLSVNTLFVGREEELKTLAKALRSGTTTVIAAATGMGGVGKTQLASEFVHRYGQFFAGGVFWLSFADATNVDAEIVACGQSMGLVRFEAQLPADSDERRQWLADQSKQVQQLWRDATPRLLVFDNCDDTKDTTAETLLDRYKPTSGGTRVLVTSRRQNWGEALGLYEQRLETLLRAESVALLRKFRPDLAVDDADLHRIAAEVGDLPLALHVAGSYLKRYKAVEQPATYLEHLRSTPLRTLAKRLAGTSPTKHNLDVARTFAVSYEQLDSQDAIDALALALLARAAYFAPNEPIPADLLMRTMTRESIQGDEMLAYDREDALTRLAELGLLEREANGLLRLHQLLAVFVQEVTSNDDAQAAVGQAIIDMATDLNNAGNPKQLLALQTHLRHAIDGALNGGDIVSAARITTASWRLWSRTGQLGEGSTLIRLIFDAITFGTLPDTLQAALHHGAGVIAAQGGSYDEAEREFMAALGIREAAGDTEQIAGLRNNLGLAAFYKGNLDTAEDHFQTTLALSQTISDEELPATAEANLGLIAIERFDFVTAASYFVKAVERFKHLGLGYKQALYLDNLGTVRRYQGQAADALQLHLDSREIRLAEGDAWGIASTYETAGWALQALGDVAAAHQSFVDGLRQFQSLPDKEGMICCLEGLAATFAAAGDHEFAAQLLAAADRGRSSEDDERPLPPAEAPARATLWAAIIAALGQEKASQAESEGARWSVAEAAARALTRAANG